MGCKTCKPQPQGKSMELLPVSERGQEPEEEPLEGRAVGTQKNGVTEAHVEKVAAASIPPDKPPEIRRCHGSIKIALGGTMPPFCRRLRCCSANKSNARRQAA